MRTISPKILVIVLSIVGLSGLFLFGNGLTMLAAPLAWYHLVSGEIHMIPSSQNFVRGIGLLQMFFGAALIFGIIHPAPRLYDVGLAQSPPTGSPERALAACVLRQATADLRRFRSAKDAVGREMYSEAFNWFNADDSDWPYSFVNVCQALSLFPETIRDEAFAHAESSWYSHFHRVAGRVATSVKAFISGLFAARNARPLAVAKS